MQTWKSFRKELLNDMKVKEEYDKLTPRYKLISQLIEARAKKGVTQQELAEKIGMKQSAIARIESGQANPTLDFLEKIAKVLGRELRLGIK